MQGRIDLKTKFKAVQRELSPTPRMFYAHTTCATVRTLGDSLVSPVLNICVQDTKQMAVILGASTYCNLHTRSAPLNTLMHVVEDLVLRQNLKHVNLL